MMMFKSGTTVPLLVGECLRNEHQPEPPALLILTAASQKFSGPLSKSTRIVVLRLRVEGLHFRYYFSHFISEAFRKSSLFWD